MKTLTEFTVSTLKAADEKCKELTTGGKTAEELPAALGEALKLEGDKLTFILAALETVGTKTQDLKRVIVHSLNEGEKAPAGVAQKGDHYYAVEYYPPLPGQSRGKGRGDDRDERGHRGGGRDKGGKGGRGGGRDASGGGRGPGRGPGGPRRDDAPRSAGPGTPGAPSTGGEGAPSNRPPRNRGPRKPRPEGAAPQKQLAPGERLPLPKPLHPDKLPPRVENKAAQPSSEQAAPENTESSSS